MTTETLIKTTKIFEANCESWLSGKRRTFNEGGTSSSKTYSILQLIVLIAASAKENFLCSVVSESIPHLKRGCIRDFQAILGPQFDYTKWNATNFIYNFGKGVVEFFPADDASKMRGGRRDILFINEANNVTHEAYRELDIRTRLHTFADWNPTSEFWYHEQRLMDHPENAYVHSTFMDCIDVLPPEVVANIESNRDRDPNWWNIYGLGLLGKIEGLVYPHFELCDMVPMGTPIFGLDFGYSNDPTTLVKNVMRDGVLFSQELLYETGLTNQNIGKRIEPFVRKLR